MQRLLTGRRHDRDGPRPRRCRDRAPAAPNRAPPVCRASASWPPSIGVIVVASSSIALVVAAHRADLQRLVRYFLKSRPTGRTRLRVPARRCDVPVGGRGAGAAWPCRHRGDRGLLSPGVNRVRHLLVDIASLAFCAFFAWKSGPCCTRPGSTDYHSGSTWGPPLWIPYSLMTVGMTLLSAADPAPDRRRARARRTPRMSRSRSVCSTAARRCSSCSPACRSPSRWARSDLFMIIFMPRGSVDTVTQNVYEEMASITLLSIPLFILKGAAIGRSPPARTSTARCMPGCTGSPAGSASPTSSPARCSRPWPVVAGDLLGDRLRRHPGDAQARILARIRRGHHRGRWHARHLLPPSITMILYAVAAEQSLGRLFLAAIGPACCWSCCSPVYAMCAPAGISRARKRGLEGRRRIGAPARRTPTRATSSRCCRAWCRS